MHFNNSQAFAIEMDQQDPLKDFRGKFFIPVHKGKETVYFTGNSLGLQPKKTSAYIQQELNDWAELGVEGHFQAKHPWFSYHEMFPPLLSKIVGAKPEELVVMNQLTVNLHLMMASFYRPGQERFRIICEAGAFPSDQYALESQAILHGLDPSEVIIEVAPRAGEYHVHTEDIVAAIKKHGKEVSLVLFGGVNYYSGQVLDMKTITKVAHDAGAYAGFDLAHAVGNIHLDLHHWEVDFACWCSYKYLNSGPGSVAGAFIHSKHITDKTLPRMAGWWGYNKETRFQMKPGFDPIATAEGWQLSNAPVISMAAHKAALDIFEEAGMHALLEKSKHLTGFLFYLLEEINKKHAHRMVEVITPKQPGMHGCQVSILMLERGKEIFKELIAAGIIADWREPNVIRVAPVPLYNSFEDVWKFGSVLEKVLDLKPRT